MIRSLAFSALLGMLLLPGCRHPSPAATFHTLAPLAQPVADGTFPAIEVMPVRLPELLQRSPIVVQDGPGIHRLSSTHRWGNSLEKDMQRVLAENLSALLGGPAVAYPLGEQARAVYRIALDVGQCDGTPGGTLQFRATWIATRTADGQTVLLRQTALQEPVPGRSIEDLVSAHDRLLERLSRIIAEELKGL